MDLKYAVVITGSIATGKSSVCKILKERGFGVVDADRISHKILDEQSDEVAKLFGLEYVDENGKVKRKELGRAIFANEDKKKSLEELLHPKIYECINKEALWLEKHKKLYFLDIPLFFETKNRYEASAVCVVYVSKEIQLARLMKRDSIEKEEAQMKIKTQLDIEEKRQRADFVIDNSGDFTHLQREVDRFIKTLKDKYENF